jgi:hypothetical protein
MRTAETARSRWRYVLWGSMNTGANEDEGNTERVWVAGFQLVTARSRLARV